MQGPASRPPSLTRDQHCGALCEGLSQSPPAALHKWVTKTQIPLKRKALPQVLLQLSAAPRIPYRVCRCTFQCAFFQIVLYLFFASIFRSVCVFSSSSYKKNNRGGRPPVMTDTLRVRAGRNRGRVRGRCSRSVADYLGRSLPVGGPEFPACRGSMLRNGMPIPARPVSLVHPARHCSAQLTIRIMVSATE